MVLIAASHAGLLATTNHHEPRELREKYGLHVETSSFGAMMDVELVNDGPFTIFVEV